MIKTVSAETVKNILRNKDKKIKGIHQKLFSLYRELESSDEMQAKDVLPASMRDGMPGAKGNHKDLDDILVRYERQVCRRQEEIRKMMWELTEQEEMVNRVWACFLALDDPYYSMLQLLYVENQLYQTVERYFELSHRTFENYRQHGIELIIRFYESGDSIADLMRHQRTDNTGKGRKSRKSKTESGYNQISLLDIAAAGEDIAEK